MTFTRESRLTAYTITRATGERKLFGFRMKELVFGADEINGEMFCKIDLRKFAELEYKKTRTTIPDPSALGGASAASIDGRIN